MNKEQREKLSDALKEAIGNMSDNRLVELWDDYCTKYVDGEFEVWDMDSFDAELRGLEPSTIVEMTNGGNFSTYNRYFRKTPYGNLESSNDPMELGIDIEELTDYIAETKNPLDNDKVYDAVYNQNLYDATYHERGLKPYTQNLNFYTRNFDSNKLYICYTEEQAKRLVAALPDAAKTNIVIAENDMEFRRLWYRPQFDALNIHYAAVIYDASNDRGNVENRRWALNLDCKGSCEINISELEKRNNKTKNHDNGLEM